MVRGKRRPLAALAAAEDYSLHGSVESLDFYAAEDLHEDGNWVIVKKQRITIWIPPPPSVHPTTTPGPPRTNNRQHKSKKRIIKRRQILPNKRQQPRKRPHEGELQNCDTVLDSSKGIQVSGGKLDSPPNSMKKFPKQVSRRTTPKGPTRLTGDESVYRPATSKSLVPDNEHARLSAIGFSPQIRVSRVFEADKNKKRLPTNNILPPPTMFRSQGPSRAHVRSISCLNMGMGVLQQNQKMRAANLERKLEKAGGLSRWLMSLGLGQFVQMFRMRNVDDKFQLLNLNMGKLKEMGAIAVGPRRKLMHAIDCLAFQDCTLSRGMI